MVETHGIGAVNLTFICNWSKTLKHSEVLEIEIVVCDVIQWDTRRAFSRKNTNWVRSHLFFVQPTVPHPFLWGQTKKCSLLLGKISQRSFIISQITLSNFFNLGVWSVGGWAESKFQRIFKVFHAPYSSSLSLSLSLEREWWIFYNSLFPRAPNTR